MNKRFVVAVQGANAFQRDALTQRMNASEVFTWWHWMDNVWLLKTVEGKTYTPRSVSDWLEKTPGWTPGIKWLVLDAESREYWGSIDARAWPWFESVWKKP